MNYTSLTGVCIFVKIRRIVKKAVTLHRLHVYNQDVSLFSFLFKNIKIMEDFSKIQRIKRAADICLRTLPFANDYKKLIENN